MRFHNPKKTFKKLKKSLKKVLTFGKVRGIISKLSRERPRRSLKIKQYSKETKQTNPLIYGSRAKPAEWVRDHNGQSWKANESNEFIKNSEKDLSSESCLDTIF